MGSTSEAGEPSDGPDGETGPPPVVAGVYTWVDYLREHGHDEAAEAAAVARERDGGDGLLASLLDRRDGGRRPGAGPDWSALDVDPADCCGFDPAALPARLDGAALTGRAVQGHVVAWLRDTPVVKDEYGWEHFKLEYHYDDLGLPPEDERGDPVPFRPAEYLGFHPGDLTDRYATAKGTAAALSEIIDRRTVNVDPDVDEDAFFSTTAGHTTLANRYDLEKAVAMADKPHFVEVERYWVDKPNAFVVVFHATTENERKYYLVSPHLTSVEADLKTYLTAKLRTTIKYSDDVVVDGSVDDRRAVIERELRRLLAQYDLHAPEERTLADRVNKYLGRAEPSESARGELDGIAARPEPVVDAEDEPDLSEYQVEKLRYVLTRDFVGYGRIDGIKHDVNVEDISCDGYDSPVFVYHTDHEQLITNLSYGEDELDNFVVKLAQRSGKSISKRHPQVDATLPDGSRAQLTLGREVSDHGTNYTIRQFNDVPFTPVDLINWHTFSLEEMVFLWLCIENNKSLIFAGGTASGKTTSLNAVSLFIPSNSKIVSIEDTREVELPQRNWVASVTRPAFAQDDGDIDEFDLLEAALRQRPEYILMGEVRGEEGRTLFQVMSTGHTTLTTFHADNVAEVIKRFTTDPINVSKTMFTALDLVSVQAQTRVQGEKIRRNRTITEINHYDTERDEINVRDLFDWQPETDQFQRYGNSALLEEIKFDRGWDEATLREEIFKRRTVLAYLVQHDLTTYAEVAATLQAFINDPDTVLALMARGHLEESLDDLRGMESVLIDIDPEKEALVPRPDPDEETLALTRRVLERAESELFEEYREVTPSPLVEALPDLDEAAALPVEPGAGTDLREAAEEVAEEDQAEPQIVSDGGDDSRVGSGAVDAGGGTERTDDSDATERTDDSDTE